MTPEEMVELTKQMRANGVTRFSIDPSAGKLSVVFGPQEPPKLVAMAEAFGELPAEHREKFLKEQKKLLDEDLYGSSQ